MLVVMVNDGILLSCSQIYENEHILLILYRYSYVDLASSQSLDLLPSPSRMPYFLVAETRRFKTRRIKEVRV